MEPTPNVPTTDPGGEIPPFKCPHCRTVNPVIEYGELVYASQRYDLDTEDWDCWEVADADGSMYVSATCQQCEQDVVLALIEYDHKHPTNQVPSSFVHEVRVPMNKALARARSKAKNPILRFSDEALENLITNATRTLGFYLDEQDARRREKAKARKQAEKAGTK